MASLSQHAVSGRARYTQLAIVYLLSAMGAYQIGSIPVQWIGSTLAVFFMLVSLFFNQRYHRAYLFPIVLILLVFFVSLAGWRWWAQSIDFQELLPVGATTAYPGFVILRYFQFIVFVAVYLVSTKFLERNGLEKLAQLLTVCGVLVSMYALYVYLAQIIGLWEIPRNRMGTGGEEQAVFFTYAFHRAMGPFREPSHLAAWLVLPLFMTFFKRSSWYIAARILIISVILLTGSLTGVVAVILGYMFSLFAVLPLRRALAGLLGFGGILLVATAVFTLFATPNPGGSTEFWRVIFERLSPIALEGGMNASNRAYVYEFVADHPIPLIGYGLGNSDILFGYSQGLGLMGGVASFYINMLYSLGYIGGLVILLFLLIPVFRLFRFRTGKLRYLLSLLAAYAGWLVVYSVLAEELSASFAILYAACIYYYSALKLKRLHPPRTALVNNHVNLTDDIRPGPMPPRGKIENWFGVRRAQ